MDLSILIVNYNTRSYLDKCLDSIFNSKTAAEFEVIVVDNNSKDGSADFIEKHYPKVILLKETQNHGFSRAMNIAYRATSNSDYLLLFNPDAEVYEDTINCGISTLNENPDVGLLGGVTIDGDGNMQYPQTAFHKIETIHSTQVLNQNTKRLDFILGTGLWVRKDSTPDYLFREDAFLFWEEWDLASRIQAIGFKLLVDERIKVLHHTSVTFKRDPVKLNLIVKLQIAYAFKNRAMTYGLGTAVLNSLIQIPDNILLLIRLCLGYLISSDANQKKLKSIMITRYAANIKAHLNCLMMGKKYAPLMNQRAFSFFNT